MFHLIALTLALFGRLNPAPRRSAVDWREEQMPEMDLSGFDESWAQSYEKLGWRDGELGRPDRRAMWVGAVRRAYGRGYDAGIAYRRMEFGDLAEVEER